MLHVNWIKLEFIYTHDVQNLLLDIKLDFF